MQENIKALWKKMTPRSISVQVSKGGVTLDMTLDLDSVSHAEAQASIHLVSWQLNKRLEEQCWATGAQSLQDMKSNSGTVDANFATLLQQTFGEKP